MTSRTIVVVVLALSFGALMAFGVLQIGSGGGSSEVAAAETESVIVVTRPVGLFRQITEDDLTIEPRLKDTITEKTVTKMEDAVGKISMANLFEGDVITLDKVDEKGPGSGMAHGIDPGMRAYTIQTSRVASNVAGFIMPGNKVDVLLSLKGSRGDVTGGGSTTALLQSVEVLAVANYTEAPDEFKIDPDEMTSVTLHVTPQQANDLDLGQNMGTLTLSLRNPEDVAKVDTLPATVSDVRFLGDLAPGVMPNGMVDEPLPPAPQAAPPKKAAPKYVVTLRGRHRGKVMLADGSRF